MSPRAPLEKHGWLQPLAGVTFCLLIKTQPSVLGPRGQAGHLVQLPLVLHTLLGHCTAVCASLLLRRSLPSEQVLPGLGRRSLMMMNLTPIPCHHVPLQIEGPWDQASSLQVTALGRLVLCLGALSHRVPISFHTFLGNQVYMGTGVPRHPPTSADFSRFVLRCRAQKQVLLCCSCGLTELWYICGLCHSSQNVYVNVPTSPSPCLMPYRAWSQE